MSETPLPQTPEQVDLDVAEVVSEVVTPLAADAAPAPAAIEAAPEPAAIEAAPEPAAIEAVLEHAEVEATPVAGAAEDAPASPVEAVVPEQKPQASRPAPKAKAAPKVQPAPEVPLDPAEFAAARKFGRVTEDGTVYVTEAAGERSVGQFPGATEEEALTFYVRRYSDLAAQVRLFESRISMLSARDLETSLKSLQEQVVEPQAVGDLDGLRQRVALAEERVADRQSEIQAEREVARAAAMVRREEIVAKAETIAAQDVTRTQWKESGEQLQALLDEWKGAQRGGPRLEKAKEDELWKRFSKARTTFDRNRRQYFADRDTEHGNAKAAKEKLIARAEALSTSTDWAATAAAYRDLMTEWKAAGRARRKDDDEMWARFRAAQQVFFDAREDQNKALDVEFGKNLELKMALLVEAEALLPITDAKEARAKLRSIDERWEAIGKVPRAEVSKVEGRMRAVEKAIKDVEDAQWRRSNPETTARVNSATAQLEAALAALEADLAKAKAAGDKKAIKTAEDAIAARQAWLEQIRSSSL